MNSCTCTIQRGWEGGGEGEMFLRGPGTLSWIYPCFYKQGSGIGETTPPPSPFPHQSSPSLLPLPPPSLPAHPSLCVYICPAQVMDSSVQIRRVEPPPPPSSSVSATLIWYTRYDAVGRLVVTIEGPGSIEDYQLLIESISYSNSAVEPDENVLMRVLSVWQCCCIHYS